jgi:hypothetical protein
MTWPAIGEDSVMAEASPLAAIGTPMARMVWAAASRSASEGGGVGLGGHGVLVGAQALGRQRAEAGGVLARGHCLGPVAAYSARRLASSGELSTTTICPATRRRPP